MKRIILNLGKYLCLVNTPSALIIAKFSRNQKKSLLSQMREIRTSGYGGQSIG